MPGLYELQVLTKPKILTVKFDWLKVEHRDDAPTRYVMDAATYERLINAVKPN